MYVTNSSDGKSNNQVTRKSKLAVTNHATWRSLNVKPVRLEATPAVVLV